MGRIIPRAGQIIALEQMKTMKFGNRSVGVVRALTLLALVPVLAPALAATIRYEAQPAGSTCIMEGTSTLHDWHMDCKLIRGFIEVDAGFPESALTNTAAARPRVEATIPVRTFKSGKAAMDKKMQEHMQVTKFPNIEYRLIELKPQSLAGSTGAIKFDAVGALTITGNTVTNTMPVTIEKTDGKLKVSGNTSLKMSDYGIEKVSFLGMTTGDELQIKLEWLTAPKAP